MEIPTKDLERVDFVDFWEGEGEEGAWVEVERVGVVVRSGEEEFGEMSSPLSVECCPRRDRVRPRGEEDLDELVEVVRDGRSREAALGEVTGEEGVGVLVGAWKEKDERGVGSASGVAAVVRIVGLMLNEAIDACISLSSDAEVVCRLGGGDSSSAASPMDSMPSPRAVPVPSPRPPPPARKASCGSPPSVLDSGEKFPVMDPTPSSDERPPWSLDDPPPMRARPPASTASPSRFSSDKGTPSPSTRPSMKILPPSTSSSPPPNPNDVIPSGNDSPTR